MSTHPILDPTRRASLPASRLARPPQSSTAQKHCPRHRRHRGQARQLVAEKTDWQQLRSAASAIRAHTLENLAFYLEQFESRCTAAGGQVHWAADAAEARQIILDLLRRENATEVIKIKTMTRPKSS